MILSCSKLICGRLFSALLASGWTLSIFCNPDFGTYLLRPGISPENWKGFPISKTLGEIDEDEINLDKLSFQCWIESMVENRDYVSFSE